MALSKAFEGYVDACGSGKLARSAGGVCCVVGATDILLRYVVAAETMGRKGIVDGKVK